MKHALKYLGKKVKLPPILGLVDKVGVQDIGTILKLDSAKRCPGTKWKKYRLQKKI